MRPQFQFHRAIACRDCDRPYSDERAPTRQSSATHPDHDRRLAEKAAEVARLLGRDGESARPAPPRPRCLKKCRPVRSVDDPTLRWPSQLDAAIYFGVGPSRVHKAVLYGQRVCGHRLEHADDQPTPARQREGERA